MRPGDSASMLTSKPGLGVAHRTSTPDAENEMAAVPPMSEKVWVVPVGAVDVEEDAGWVVGAWVGSEFAEVVDDDGWFRAAVLVEDEFNEVVVDEVVAAWPAAVDDVDGLVIADPLGSVVAVAPADPTSTADGGATT